MYLAGMLLLGAIAWGHTSASKHEMSEIQDTRMVDSRHFPCGLVSSSHQPAVPPFILPPSSRDHHRRAHDAAAARTGPSVVATAAVAAFQAVAAAAVVAAAAAAAAGSSSRPSPFENRAGAPMHEDTGKRHRSSVAMLLPVEAGRDPRHLCTMKRCKLRCCRNACIPCFDQSSNLEWP